MNSCHLPHKYKCFCGVSDVVTWSDPGGGGWEGGVVTWSDPGGEGGVVTWSDPGGEGGVVTWSDPGWGREVL